MQRYSLPFSIISGQLCTFSCWTGSALLIGVTGGIEFLDCRYIYPILVHMLSQEHIEHISLNIAESADGPGWTEEVRPHFPEETLVQCS